MQQGNGNAIDVSGIAGTITVYGTTGCTGTVLSGPTSVSTNASGHFSDSSYSPAAAGTEYVQAAFATQTVGGNSYTQKNSPQCATLTVNPPANTAPNDPTSLAQYKSNGTTTIATGGATNESTVVLKGSVSDPDSSDTVKLEVEVKPVGTAFDGTGLVDESALGANPHTGSATVSSLADGSYHWRARSVDNHGATSGWVSYGGNAETAADFVVDTVAPDTFIDAPPPSNPSSDTSPSISFHGTDTGGSGVASFECSSMLARTLPAPAQMR